MEHIVSVETYYIKICHS